LYYKIKFISFEIDYISEKNAIPVKNMLETNMTINIPNTII